MDIHDLLEKYVEEGLFRDLNIPIIKKMFDSLADDLMQWKSANG